MHTLPDEMPRCGHCGERAAPLEIDATSTLACYACFVPDITAPQYRRPLSAYVVPAPRPRTRRIAS